MVAAIFLSRILGLARDMVVSYYFGASVSMVSDAYKSAFSLPDLLYYLIAGGALSSAFIPVFTEYLEKGEEDEAWKVFSVFGTAIFLALAATVVVGELATEWFLRTFLVPGFDAEKLALTASLTRIILPAQLFFFVGGLMMSTLYVRNRFLMPALGPVVYNVAIVVGGIIGGRFYGSHAGVYGLAWGVVAGAFIGNVVMQMWEIRRAGVCYRPSLDVRHPGVIKVARLMLPVLLGLSLPQLCIILTRPFGSFLEQGSISWIDNASKLMQLPLGIFAQAVSVAIFPALSALAARRDLPGLRKQFSLGLRSILFMTLPSAVLIFVLAEPLTALLYQRGLWSWEDTQGTAQAAMIYAFAIFAVSGQQLVNRGFYAMQNTVTPMIVGTAATVVYLALNFALAPLAQTRGLALSYVVVNTGALLWLLLLFKREAHGLRTREISSSVERVILVSAVMGLVVWLIRAATDRLFHAYGPHGVHLVLLLVQLGLCAGVGVALYLTGVKLLRVPEAEFVLGAVGGRFRRLLGRR
jgi:putative peptidoglycan lipid II flippase